MYTGTYLNPSNVAFKKKLNSEIYVDKTDLIKFCNSRVQTGECFICSTRPRRFGKSMAIDMLAAYYSKGCDSKDLFNGLNVTQYNIEKEISENFTKYMNAFDVIRIDMQSVMSNIQRDKSIDAVDWIQREVIKELKEVYGDCIEEGYGLSPILKNIYKLKKKQFIILIDEWDALFRLDKNNKVAQEDYITFLRSLFKGVDIEECIALAYITGILPIKKYGGESALNNFREFSMVKPKKMTPYIGFTEEEVKKLCYDYDMDFDEIKNWYDGYKLKNEHVYSPNSVCEAIINEELMNYWVSTDTYESLKMYISLNFEGLKDDIISMLAGGEVSVKIDLFKNDIVSFNSKNDVLVCLAHLGYLAYDAGKKKVFIPNKEVRAIFEDTIDETDWTEVINAIRDSEQLMEDTLRGRSDKVAKAVAEVHSKATSINKYNDENSLSCAITLAYYSAMNDYKLIRELPSGVGYADVVFIPRHNVIDKPAIVVELKCNKNAKTAINQIRNRKYGENLKDYVGKILLVGINYDKNDENKVHTCVIEEFKKEN